MAKKHGKSGKSGKKNQAKSKISNSLQESGVIKYTNPDVTVPESKETHLDGQADIADIKKKIKIAAANSAETNIDRNPSKGKKSKKQKAELKDKKGKQGKAAAESTEAVPAGMTAETAIEETVKDTVTAETAEEPAVKKIEQQSQKPLSHKITKEKVYQQKEKVYQRFTGKADKTTVTEKSAVETGEHFVLQTSFLEDLVKLLLRPYYFFETTFLNSMLAYNFMLVFSVFSYALYLFWQSKKSMPHFYSVLKDTAPVFIIFLVIIIPVSALILHILSKSMNLKSKGKERYGDSLSILCYSVGAASLLFLVVALLWTGFNYWMQFCGSLTAWTNTSKQVIPYTAAFCFFYACFVAIRGYSVVYDIKETWSAAIVTPVSIVIAALSIYLSKIHMINIIFKSLGVK